MKVRTIAVSKPIAEIGESASDLIAYTARVSNPSNQHNTKTAPQLLRYLAKHQHWSPFEMSHMCVEITTTRDIARQILRHRSFSFQEFSQRYAEVEEDMVIREARMQDLKNRQSSLECDDPLLADKFLVSQYAVWDKALAAYQWALSRGIAKEQARAFLPEGLTVSRMYMSGSVRSWIHYVHVRTTPGTQKEHRMIAEAVKSELLRHFPSLSEILNADST